MQQKLELLRATPFAREPACQKILDFVGSSRRGLCMPRSARRTASRAPVEGTEVEVIEVEGLDGGEIEARRLKTGGTGDREADHATEA